MVPYDDRGPSDSDSADQAEEEWLDGLGLWRDGLDQATRPDLRRVVVSRLDPPLARRVTGEMEVIAVVPGAGAPEAPDRPYNPPYERVPLDPAFQDPPEEHPLEDPPRAQPDEHPLKYPPRAQPDGPRMLPTTPMLSMTPGGGTRAVGRTNGNGSGNGHRAGISVGAGARTTTGPVGGALAEDGLRPIGRVVRPEVRRVRAQPAAGSRRRLGHFGLAVGVVVAVMFAWFVLVVARTPSSEDAPVDAVGSRIDDSLLDSLLADRMQSFVGWIVSVTTTLVLGGVIFQLFVAGSRVSSRSPRSSRSPIGNRAGLSLLRKAAVVGICAELVSLLLRAAAVSAAGFDAALNLDTLRFVMAGRFGDAALVRIAGLALLAGFLPVLPIGPASRRPALNGRDDHHVNGHGGLAGVDRMLVERAACLLGGAVILLSYAIVGHPQATRPAYLFVPAQGVHLVAISTWFGGVAFLAIELRQQKQEGSAREFAEVVRRFSTVAGVAIAVAGVTGLLMANSQLGSLEELQSTPYGKALLVKVAVLTIPVAIGAYNRQRLVPAILHRDEPSAWRHLRTTLVLEATFIALGVLLATAAMTSGGFK